MNKIGGKWNKNTRILLKTVQKLPLLLLYENGTGMIKNEQN